MKKNTFYMLFDKALLAVFVAAVGYFINKSLEKIKSQSTIEIAIEQERIKRISSLWDLLYETESQIFLIQSELMALCNRNATREDLDMFIQGAYKRMTQQFNQLEKKAVEQANKERFWLGKLPIAKVIKFQQLLREAERELSILIQSLKNEDLNAKQVLNRIGALRQNLEIEHIYITDMILLEEKK